MKSVLSFRPARPDEAAELTQIAIDSKRTWGYGDDPMSVWIPGLTFTPANISARTVSVAEMAGVPVAVSSLCISDSESHLDEFWVRPCSIGTGVGRQLLKFTLALASQAGFESVTVVSDPNAEGFYRRFGGIRVRLRESLPKRRFLPVLRVPTNHPS